MITREEYEARMKKIKTIQGAIAPMSDYIDSLEQHIKSLEAQLANTEQLTCNGCKYFIEKYDDEMDIEICDCIVNIECRRNYIPYYCYPDLYEPKE